MRWFLVISHAIHIHTLRFSLWLWVVLVLWKVSRGVDELCRSSWVLRIIWMVNWWGIEQDVCDEIDDMMDWTWYRMDWVIDDGGGL